MANMNVKLDILLPKRPWRPNFPQRKVYNVILGNGVRISLKTLALKLDIPYNTLFKEVECLSFGSHTQGLVDAIARCRAKNRRRAKSTVCPACKGRGRVLNQIIAASPPDSPTADTAEIINGN